MSANPRRALVVIDVQNEYVSGDLPIEFPPIDTSLANIGRAMDAARAAGVPLARDNIYASNQRARANRVPA